MSDVPLSREEVARKVLNGEFDDYHLIHKKEVIADALKIKRLEIERNLAIGEENAAKTKCDTANALLAEALKELDTIEAVTVSPTDVDGLMDLIKRMKAHLGVK